TVNGPISNFLVTPSSLTPMAGDAINVTVTARDSGDRTINGYTGTVHFTSTDLQAVLPSNYTFTSAPSGDSGVHTFTGVMLKTAGTQTISVNDTVASVTGTSANIAVGFAAADHYVVTA